MFLYSMASTTNKAADASVDEDPVTDMLSYVSRYLWREGAQSVTVGVFTRCKHKVRWLISKIKR